MKYKSFFALVLAAAIIAGGAVLPMAVAAVQDAMGSKQAAFAPMNAVSLEFEQSRLTIGEKLALGGDADASVEIPEELAARTGEEIKKLAAELLAPYQEAGLLHDEIFVESQTQLCAPVLVYMKSDSKRSNIFWHLSISPEDAIWSLFLFIDDETGRLCSIEYSAGTNDLAYLPVTGSRKDQLQKFCEIYMDGLGDAFQEQSDTTFLDYAWPTANDNGLSTWIGWEDSYSGERRITLHVGTYGFYSTYY